MPWFLYSLEYKSEVDEMWPGRKILECLGKKNFMMKNV